jgi:hypothetical protein
MPLKFLYAMARSYLRVDFGFNVLNDHEIELSYEDQVLPLFGVLGDVPVLDQAVIQIEYPLMEEMASFAGNGGGQTGKKDYSPSQVGGKGWFIFASWGKLITCATCARARSKS